MKKILIIEDDEYNLEVLKSTLQEMGLESLIFFPKAYAKELVFTELRDLILEHNPIAAILDYELDFYAWNGRKINGADLMPILSESHVLTLAFSMRDDHNKVLVKAGACFIESKPGLPNQNIIKKIMVPFLERTGLVFP